MKIRALMINIFWTVLAAALGALCLSAANFKRNAALKGVDVQIVGVENGAYFLRPADIEHQMKEIIGPLDKHTIGDVSCDIIEKELSANPFIDNIEVYVSGNGVLTARITEREPVLRVIGDGVSYYLDARGRRMPVSQNFTPRVQVVTGALAGMHADALLDLVQQIHADKFMDAFIGQIYYADKNNVILIPETGRAQIFFGPPERIAEKFENLKAFYSEVVAETGWDRYNTIDLRFRDQIICKKNPTS